MSLREKFRKLVENSGDNFVLEFFIEKGPIAYAMIQNNEIDAVERLAVIINRYIQFRHKINPGVAISTFTDFGPSSPTITKMQKFYCIPLIRYETAIVIFPENCTPYYLSAQEI